MDDLTGLDWNASSSSGAKKPPFAPAGSNYFPSVRPPQQQATPPLSGRSTPAYGTNTAASASAVNSKPSTPLQSNNASGTSASKDSFANLFASSTAGANANKNLSLAEQQRRLQQQKLQQQASGSVGGNISEDAWARLGGASGGFGTGSSGSTIPSTSRQGPASTNPAGQQTTGPRIQAPIATRPSPTFGKSTESEADVLAAFNKEAPVDKSSHFPPPSSGSSSKTGTPAAQQPGFGGSGGGLLGNDDDDDPFGLGSSAPKQYTTNSSVPATTLDDDYDILGDLGKPVSQLPQRPSHRSPAPVATRSPAPVATQPPADSHDDKAVAELVDMGFPADKASQALEATDGNVQAAVSWLLTRAHEESRSKTQTPVEDGRRPTRKQEDGSRSSSTQRRGTPGSQNREDRDPGQKASEIGTSIWKGANALWKQGKKQLDKAVADFNTDQDSSQPKWMREAGNGSRSASASRPQPSASPVMTDEAMMLDSHDRPQSRPRRQDASSPGGSSRVSRDQSPALPARPASNQPSTSAKPAWQQPAVPSSRSKLSRQMVEEQEAQAYVSPARRKKAMPQPLPEGDLLDGSSAPVRNKSPLTSATSKTSQQNARLNPITVRPAAKTRPVPSISAITMKSCTQHRAAGTVAFKKGDYSAAETSYSSAIAALPTAHPLVILLLTNRATTRLKTGDTKGALADADQAIELVGPARGADESIEVPDEDGDGSSKTTSKDMGAFWGKAIMRRAEALEHMERWSDAAASWREAVEGGIGGANAIRARNRCESAGRPKPKSAAAPPPRAAATTAAATSRNRAPDARSAAGAKPIDLDPRKAVSRLREANAQAEKADEERFRLSDSVDGRIAAWRGGKEGNLRALLGSLDTVLWPDSGWKKVGMGELLAPNKVKIAYMKGIAKVHPDKLPQGATTEQVMISGAVFATLNEAWDRFKAENGL